MYFLGAARHPDCGIISSLLHISSPFHLLPDAASEVVVVGELWKQADNFVCKQKTDCCSDLAHSFVQKTRS